MYFFNSLSSAFWPQTTTAPCVEDLHGMEVENRGVETALVEVEEAPKLVSDVLSVIFSNVDWPSLRAACCVSKEWSRIASLIMEAKKWVIYDSVACSPDFWAMHTGKEVTTEERQRALSMLPTNIEEILYSPCPVFSGKLVKDTHDLVYIRKELTLTLLGELAESKLDGSRKRNVKGYAYIQDKILPKFDQPVEDEYWVLMTNDVLGGEDLGPKGSRDKSYDVQRGMVQELSKTSNKHYEIPKTLEAVAVVIAHLLKTGEYILGRRNDLQTSTRCQEQIGDWNLSVGCFGPSGLRVYYYYDVDILGVAGLRKFFLGSR